MKIVPIATKGQVQVGGLFGVVTGNGKMFGMLQVQFLGTRYGRDTVYIMVEKEREEGVEVFGLGGQARNGGCGGTIEIIYEGHKVNIEAKKVVMGKMVGGRE